ncbi:MAG: hypothetical protein AAFW97_08535 [Pseudomonadota bacterium]
MAALHSYSYDAQAAELALEDIIETEYFVDLRTAIPIAGRGNFLYNFRGDRALFLTRKAHLRSDAVVYRLFMAHVNSGRTQVQVEELVSAASHNNNPAIFQVRWIDNHTVSFIAQDTEGRSQIFSADTTGDLTSYHRTGREIFGYGMNSSGDLVFGVRTETTSVRDNAGGYVVDTETFDDIAGIRRHPSQRGINYFVVTTDGARALPCPSQPNSSIVPYISVAPSGRFAVIQSAPQITPPEWAALPLSPQAVPFSPPHSAHAELMLVDLNSGRCRSLTGAPMANALDRNQVLWDDANSRLFVFNQFLSAQNAASIGYPEPQDPVIAEYSLEQRRVVRVVDTVSGRSSQNTDLGDYDHSWDRLDGDDLVTTNGGSRTLYRLINDQWRKVGSSLTAQPAYRPFLIEIEQDISRVPRLIARIPSLDDALAIYTPNPETRRAFLAAQRYEWTDADGRSWEAGLILPEAHREGQRLPLVIYSHTYRQDDFIVTGTRGASSGFSAQAFANAGFAVLIIGRASVPVSREQEFSAASEGYRSVIDRLSEDGVIDRERVGIVAWSRSGFWLQYALAEHPNLFGTALVADASSFGTFNFLYFHNWRSVYQRDYLTNNGLPPFGTGLNDWIRFDPVTSARPFSLPLRIEHYGYGFPTWWEPYLEMTSQGEPVEYFHLPTAAHTPLRPSHQLIVQSAALDWFRFWLLSEENDNPLDSEQYERWREMRNDRCARADLRRLIYCEYAHNDDELDEAIREAGLGVID